MGCQDYPPLCMETGLSNITLFVTYSFLLSYKYGSGNYSMTADSCHGQAALKLGLMANTRQDS